MLLLGIVFITATESKVGRKENGELGTRLSLLFTQSMPLWEIDSPYHECTDLSGPLRKRTQKRRTCRRQVLAKRRLEMK